MIHGTRAKAHHAANTLKKLFRFMYGPDQRPNNRDPCPRYQVEISFFKKNLEPDIAGKHCLSVFSLRQKLLIQSMGRLPNPEKQRSLLSDNLPFRRAKR